MNIVARDNGEIPNRSGNTATVTVSVYRNIYTPQFINEFSYSKEIDEDITVGTLVTQVTATDADEIVS